MDLRVILFSEPKRRSENELIKNEKLNNIGPETWRSIYEQFEALKKWRNEPVIVAILWDDL